MRRRESSTNERVLVAHRSHQDHATTFSQFANQVRAELFMVKAELFPARGEERKNRTQGYGISTGEYRKQSSRPR